MSTADCKSLLVSRFPGTVAKDWKRETKYLNFNETEIRRFKHPVAGSVYVDEDRQEISLTDAPLQFSQASKLKAEDFYFSISMCHGQDAPCWAVASIVHRYHFDTEGCLDSIHLEHLVEKFFPRDVSCCEEQESIFAIDEEFSAAELIEKFTKAGFIPSSELDNFISGVDAPRDDPVRLVISDASLSLLARAFPKAQPQYWTLLSRHLNHQGIEVSVLYHYVYGQAWIIEDDAEVTQAGWWHCLQDASKLIPKDYFAWAIGGGDSCVRAYFVLKQYFEREQQAEDVELDCLEAQIPKIMGRLEILEGAGVEFLEQTDPKLVMMALLEQGFWFSEAFRDHIEAEYSGH